MAETGKPNELRLTRVYDAPVSAVWDAWTIVEQVEKWWGPRGFTITTHSKDLRPGGNWRYTMHGPDGVNYPNVTLYHVVEPYRRLVYDHGATDETPPLFRVTVTFSETDGRTTMEMIMALATAEAAVQTAKFVKKAGGNATWDRLAEHLEEARGRRCFVINRTFDAPIERVLEMWTDPERLASWLPPASATIPYLRAETLSTDSPRRLVYAQRLVDERLDPNTTWPRTLVTTVTLVDETPERTRVTVMTAATDDATGAEIDALVRERTPMTYGWYAAFDALEDRLGPNQSSLGA